MTRLLLSLLLLSVVAVWGWTFVVVKDAVAGYGVLPFLAIRYTIATGVLAAAVAWRVRWPSFWAGAGIGLALAAGYLFQTFGLRLTTASNSGVITGLFVFFVPGANRLLFGVRTRPLVWAAIGVSLVGLALLSGGAPQGANAGDALTLGCAAAFGLHVVLLDRYARRHDVQSLVLGQLSAATALFVAGCLLFELPSWPSGGVWRAILVTAVLATAVAFFVQTFVQQRLPAVPTAMILLLEPLFAALFGYLLHGDRLTGLQIAGAALLSGAALVVELSPLVRRRGGPASAPSTPTRG
ncbi:MAG TPA: DMT family transporter [Planctomycetota bacterium]|nr:DMT family transporter [Planctomycetota bacterium]HRR80264.1 DMT family transporter [Planctomycetota bacterium]HRT93372.1 DMT family transporter [Planctomycetota bacterium]